jgi:hypothetical protein
MSVRIIDHFIVVAPDRFRDDYCDAQCADNEPAGIPQGLIIILVIVHRAAARLCARLGWRGSCCA